MTQYVRRTGGGGSGGGCDRPTAGAHTGAHAQTRGAVWCGEVFPFSKSIPHRALSLVVFIVARMEISRKYFHKGAHRNNNNNNNNCRMGGTPICYIPTRILHNVRCVRETRVEIIIII